MNKLNIILLVLSILLPCVVLTLNTPTVGSVYSMIFTSFANDPIITYFNSLAFVQDTDQNAYISSDNGINWEPIDDVVSSEIFVDSNSNLVMFQDSTCTTGAESTVLYFYNTTNAAVSNFSYGDICFGPISQHPTESDFLVTLVSDLENGDGTVMVSTDFGQSWKSIQSQFIINESPIWDSASTDGLFLMGNNNNTNTHTLLYLSLSDINHIYTLLDNVTQFVHSNYLHYWALTNNGQLYLISSKNEPTTVSLYADGLQVSDFNSFVILDDNPQNGAYVAAYQLGQLANVFQYDGNDGVFDQVFNGVFVDNFLVDFMPLLATPGYYALNSQTSVNNDTFFTYYTTDNGATWNQFVDGNGDNLNFYGYISYGTNQTAPLYGSPSSLGITIGNGAVGPLSLDESPSSVANTYLSRDSGYTWSLVFPGETMYEFGNYGNFLVVVPKPNPNNLAFYSIDQGLSFQNISLPAQVDTFDIFNIVSNPSDSQQLTFTFLYYLPTGAAMFSIDFFTVGYPECAPSDFEVVSVYGNSSDPSISCVDGTVTMYNRRKQDSQCLSNIAPSQSSTDTCTCTYADYECDIGYRRAKGPNPLNCVSVNQNPPQPQQPANCPVGTNYTITRGYKRIFGDSCINGVSVQLDPISTPCIGNNTGSSSDQPPATTTGSSSSVSSSSDNKNSTNSQSSSDNNNSSNSQSSDNNSSNNNSSNSTTPTSSSSNENTGTSGSITPTSATGTSGSFSQSTGNTGNTGNPTTSNSFTSGSLDGTGTGSGSASDSIGDSSNGSNNNNGKSSSSEKPKHNGHKGVVAGVIISFVVVVGIIIFIMYRYPNLRVKLSKCCRGSEFTYSKLTKDSDYLIYEDGDHDEEEE